MASYSKTDCASTDKSSSSFVNFGSLDSWNIFQYFGNVSHNLCSMRFLRVVLFCGTSSIHWEPGHFSTAINVRDLGSSKVKGACIWYAISPIAYDVLRPFTIIVNYPSKRLALATNETA